MPRCVRMFQALLACVLLPACHGQTGTSSFHLDKSAEVPGMTLHAGQYSITVLDSLADRVVMKLDSDNGKKQTLLLGVRAAVHGTAGQPIFWPEKEQGKRALRGFAFQDGQAVEFVYPKADAVALAQKNHESVVAVDPASEGRPELNRLSSRDMQMVSLWMLTPTRVGPGENGIAAKHFEATVPQPQGAPTTIQTASATASTRTQTAAPTTTVAASTSHAAKRPVPRNSVPLAHASAPPAGVTRLPQTGSTTPLLLAVTGLALFGAGATRRVRSRAEQV